MPGKDVTTMNKVILMGRLTKNPEIKYAGKDNDMAVARYTFAVNRRYKRDGEQEADFGWVYYIKSVNAQKIVMGLEVKIN